MHAEKHVQVWRGRVQLQNQASLISPNTTHQIVEIYFQQQHSPSYCVEHPLGYTRKVSESVASATLAASVAYTDKHHWGYCI